MMNQNICVIYSTTLDLISRYGLKPTNEIVNKIDDNNHEIENKRFSNSIRIKSIIKLEKQIFHLLNHLFQLVNQISMNTMESFIVELCKMVIFDIQLDYPYVIVPGPHTLDNQLLHKYSSNKGNMCFFNAAIRPFLCNSYAFNTLQTLPLDFLQLESRLTEYGKQFHLVIKALSLISKFIAIDTPIYEAFTPNLILYQVFDSCGLLSQFKTDQQECSYLFTTSLQNIVRESIIGFQPNLYSSFRVTTSTTTTTTTTLTTTSTSSIKNENKNILSGSPPSQVAVKLLDYEKSIVYNLVISIHQEADGHQLLNQLFHQNTNTLSLEKYLVHHFILSSSDGVTFDPSFIIQNIKSYHCSDQLARFVNLGSPELITTNFLIIVAFNPLSTNFNQLIETFQGTIDHIIFENWYERSEHKRKEFNQQILRKDVIQTIKEISSDKFVFRLSFKVADVLLNTLIDVRETVPLAPQEGSENITIGTRNTLFQINDIGAEFVLHLNRNYSYKIPTKLNYNIWDALSSFYINNGGNSWKRLDPKSFVNHIGPFINEGHYVCAMYDQSNRLYIVSDNICKKGPMDFRDVSIIYYNVTTIDPNQRDPKLKVVDIRNLAVVNNNLQVLGDPLFQNNIQYVYQHYYNRERSNNITNDPIPLIDSTLSNLLRELYSIEINPVDSNDFNDVVFKEMFNDIISKDIYKLFQEERKSTLGSSIGKDIHGESKMSSSISLKGSRAGSGNLNNSSKSGESKMSSSSSSSSLLKSIGNTTNQIKPTAKSKSNESNSDCDSDSETEDENESRKDGNRRIGMLTSSSSSLKDKSSNAGRKRSSSKVKGSRAGRIRKRSLSPKNKDSISSKKKRKQYLSVESESELDVESNSESEDDNACNSRRKQSSLLNDRISRVGRKRLSSSSSSSSSFKDRSSGSLKKSKNKRIVESDANSESKDVSDSDSEDDNAGNSKGKQSSLLNDRNSSVGRKRLSSSSSSSSSFKDRSSGSLKKSRKYSLDDESELDVESDANSESKDVSDSDSEDDNAGNNKRRSDRDVKRRNSNGSLLCSSLINRGGRLCGRLALEGQMFCNVHTHGSDFEIPFQNPNLPIEDRVILTKVCNAQVKGKRTSRCQKRTTYDECPDHGVSGCERIVEKKVKDLCFRQTNFMHPCLNIKHKDKDCAASHVPTPEEFKEPWLEYCGAKYRNTICMKLVVAGGRCELHPNFNIHNYRNQNGEFTSQAVVHNHDYVYDQQKDHDEEVNYGVVGSCRVQNVIGGITVEELYELQENDHEAFDKIAKFTYTLSGNGEGLEFDRLISITKSKSKIPCVKVFIADGEYITVSRNQPFHTVTLESGGDDQENEMDDLSSDIGDDNSSNSDSDDSSSGDSSSGDSSSNDSNSDGDDKLVDSLSGISGKDDKPFNKRSYWNNTPVKDSKFIKAGSLGTGSLVSLSLKNRFLKLSDHSIIGCSVLEYIAILVLFNVFGQIMGDGHFPRVSNNSSLCLGHQIDVYIFLALFSFISNRIPTVSVDATGLLIVHIFATVTKTLLRMFNPIRGARSPQFELIPDVVFSHIVLFIQYIAGLMSTDGGCAYLSLNSRKDPPFQFYTDTTFYKSKRIGLKTNLIDFHERIARTLEEQLNFKKLKLVMRYYGEGSAYSVALRSGIHPHDIKLFNQLISMHGCTSKLVHHIIGESYFSYKSNDRAQMTKIFILALKFFEKYKLSLKDALSVAIYDFKIKEPLISPSVIPTVDQLENYKRNRSRSVEIPTAKRYFTKGIIDYLKDTGSIGFFSIPSKTIIEEPYESILDEENPDESILDEVNPDESSPNESNSATIVKNTLKPIFDFFERNKHEDYVDEPNEEEEEEEEKEFKNEKKIHRYGTSRLSNFYPIHYNRIIGIRETSPHYVYSMVFRSNSAVNVDGFIVQCYVVDPEKVGGEDDDFNEDDENWQHYRP